MIGLSRPETEVISLVAGPETITLRGVEYEVFLVTILYECFYLIQVSLDGFIFNIF